MSGLFLHTGNRLESLARHLAAEIARPGRDPLRPEMVIVQSRGMEHWLTGELCRCNRILANVQFPFPNHLIDQILAAAGVEARGGLYTRDVLLFRVLRMLPELAGHQHFATLASYLGDTPSAVKRLQLCQAIAQTFDSYTLYRPDLLAAWRGGEGEDWQAHLWRKLLAEEPEPHRGELYQRAIDLLLAAKCDPDHLPERVFAFGISSLPPMHLELFRALATRIPVTLYLLNPCREYWSDLVAPRRRALLTEAGGEYWESGNPLLSSLGRKGQEFLGQLESCDELQHLDYSQEPQTGTILGRIQHDILTLASPGGGKAMELPQGDRSLQVHSCHSPMREIEVLQDQLLALLADDPSLDPADILVMTPEIETYAPCIEAVFGALPASDSRRIPYSIADRSPASEGGVGKVLLALLNFVGGRFSLSSFFDLLEHPLLRERFDLSEDDLVSARELCRRAGIRWGIDAGHRAGLGLPPFDDYSWKAGLDRLLLSWAVSEGDDLVAGLLPLDGIGREQAERIGRIAEVVAACRDLRDVLQQPATLREWQQRFESVIDRFCRIRRELEGERMLVSSMLHRMAENGELARFSDPAGLDLVLPWLEKTFSSAASSHGFLSGGVTFCALLPLRSIPFRVIAMIGMNDNEFPRRDQRPGFDLMQQQRRSGDPNRRDEDRYLFLEAILSARDNLLISYVGQSMKDNAEIPPSVVVSELLDYLMSRFGEDARSLVCLHRLQPFSPGYFSPESRLFSFAAEQARGALARQNPHPIPPFCNAPSPLEGELILTPQEMIRFFTDPAAWFLRARLGMALEDPGLEEEDIEPFSLDGLGRYQLRDQLLQRRLSGLEDDEAWRPAVHLLPPGQIGSALLDRTNEEIEPLLTRFGEILKQPRGGEIAVDLASGPVRIQGSLPGIADGRQIVLKPGKLGGKDILRGWILHLLISQALSNEEVFTLLIGTDLPARRFVPIREPQPYLDTLLDLLHKGALEPLPFFVQSASAYVEALVKGKGVDKGISAALKLWEGGHHLRGEREGKGVKRCFPHVDPLCEPVIGLALTIFTPLFTHLEEAHD